jgi:hypothetical protein
MVAGPGCVRILASVDHRQPTVHRCRIGRTSPTEVPWR